MKKVYYVGDWAILTGPVFAETPFHHSPKGLEIFNYGVWLKEALEKDPENQVNTVSAWDFYNLIIFSDVDAKLFQLSPKFFDRSKFGKEILTFPDRIRLSVEHANAGGRYMFLGGWYSFNGELGKGGWGRTRLREMLPVKCLDIEDLVETTEGFSMEITPEGKALCPTLNLDGCPPILGYNKTIELEDSIVIARYKETGDPAIIIRNTNAGKVLAYTSDPCPHWGCNFVFWDGYAAFWQSLAKLVLA
ncbi:MAG: glutamine amidotransferase [Bacteroidetes bacterium]|nr:glutamine amidotransferase [Bacteroidota bacterium]